MLKGNSGKRKSAARPRNGERERESEGVADRRIHREDVLSCYSYKIIELKIRTHVHRHNIERVNGMCVSGSTRELVWPTSSISTLVMMIVSSHRGGPVLIRAFYILCL